MVKIVKLNLEPMTGFSSMDQSKNDMVEENWEQLEDNWMRPKIQPPKIKDNPTPTLQDNKSLKEQEGLPDTRSQQPYIYSMYN